MNESRNAPHLLLVGGGGGLLGREFLPALSAAYRLRSVHRNPAPAEIGAGVEWVRSDIADVEDWAKLLEGVDVVVNLAWYRQAPRRRFERLYGGLHRLLEASGGRKGLRFLHVSVPSAPADLETNLPYLSWKRRFDAELAASGLSYRIVRPTMMFAPRDRLLSVMLRLIERYPVFPLFGDGEYHVSPIAAMDVAEILVREASGTHVGTADLGGPVRYRYLDLLELMFAALGRRPRLWRMSARSSEWLATLFERVGSSLLYAYEVKWLLSDQLGLPPTDLLDRPLRRVEPFLVEETARIRGS